MSKTPHAAVRAPQQAERPKATLPQLGELVAQMNKGQVDRDYMQDFLRRRLVRLGPVQAVLPPEPAPNALLAKMEEIAREHYPHAVEEILEVVAPFCDPHLDLEFKPFKQGTLVNGCSFDVQRALFWLKVTRVEVWTLCHPRVPDKSPPPRSPDEKLCNRVYREMFTDVFRTYDLLNTVSEEGVNKMLCLNVGLYRHVNARFKATGAFRYGLLDDCIDLEGMSILTGILSALEKAIIFAVTGDKARLAHVVNFLTFQRSGHPVYHWHEGTAYVLALCKE